MIKLLLRSIVFLCTMLPFKLMSQQPSDISGLKLWLDAADVTGTGTNPAGGSSITTWNDKSGNNNHAVTATGQNAAQLVTNEVNGKPVLRFTRVSQATGSVYRVAGLDIRATTNPSVTIFTVYKQGARSGNQGLWGDDNGDWDRFYFTTWPDVGTADNGGASLGPSNPAAIIKDAGLPGITRSLTAIYNYGVANGSSIYFNGQVVTNFTDNTHLTNAQTSFYLGFDGDDNCYNGDVAEVLIYNKKLTACELLKINRYLVNKYDLKLTTITVTASGTTTFEQGKTVTLTASANGTDAATTYQWLRNGSPVSGATAVALTTGTAGDYRVVLNNGCVDTSAVTTVTVAALAGTAPIVCRGNQTAALKATVEGGAGNAFTIKWYKNDVAFTTNITSQVSGNSTQSTATVLGAGKYKVEMLNPANTVLITTQYELTDPATLTITPGVTGATCFNKCDAKVVLTAAGGVTPYLYTFATNAPTGGTNYNNLCSGTYAFSVTDNNGCTVSGTPVVIANPAAANIGLYKDTLLCKGSTLTVNATNALPATYAWTNNNGFTSTNSIINVTAAGTYKVTVNQTGGCTYLDSIKLRLTAQEAVPAKMVLTAHGFLNEAVVAVNLTDGQAQTQAWTIPTGAQVISQSTEKLVMQFPVKGQYEVKLAVSSYDACKTRDSAIVLIDPATTGMEVNPQEVLVREVLAAPNPTTGPFNLSIKLNQPGKVAVRIYSVTGLLAYSTLIPDNGSTSIIQPVNLVGQNKGTYVIVVETASSNEVRKIVLN